MNPGAVRVVCPSCEVTMTAYRLPERCPHCTHPLTTDTPPEPNPDPLAPGPGQLDLFGGEA